MEYKLSDVIEVAVIFLLLGCLLGGFITHIVSYDRYQECVKANQEWSGLNETR